MTINFGCKGCGRLLKVKGESTGKRIRCPHCQEVQLVAGDDASPATTRLTETATASQSKPAAEPLLAGLLLLMAGVGAFLLTSELPGNISPVGAVVLVVCGIAAILAFSRKREASIYTIIVALLLTFIWTFVTMIGILRFGGGRLYFMSSILFGGGSEFLLILWAAWNSRAKKE